MPTKPGMKLVEISAVPWRAAGWFLLGREGSWLTPVYSGVGLRGFTAQSSCLPLSLPKSHLHPSHESMGSVYS